MEQSTTTGKRILVIDDEDTLCEAIRFNLQADGYIVDVAHSAEEALTLDLSRYNLILLDIMMGDISGTQLARIIKSKPDTARIPIIFCTARDSEDDMIDGLNLGADDYITKPFSMRNLLARIRTVLRRANPATDSAAVTPEGDDGIIIHDGLTVNPARKIVTVDGREVKMPRKEYEILLTLITHPGRIYSREELLKKIWPDEVIVLDRVVDVNITRIRQKLGPYGKNIITRSGYGYGYIK